MKTRISLLGKLIVGIVIAVAIAGTLAKCWPSIAKLSAACDYRWLGAAALAALVYRVLNASGWGLILRSLGSRLPIVQGIRLWLVAETMRWLPGSIWGYCSRVYQAQKAGVPAAAASLSMPLELVVTILAWMVAAAAGGIGLKAVFAPMVEHLSVGWLLALGLFCGAAGLGLMWRNPRNRFVRKATALGGDLARVVTARPRFLPLAGSLGLFVALAFFNGAAFYAVLRAFTSHAPPLGATVGINAFGWLIGFFAIFSPGGLGVREGGMAALLAPFVPLEIAVGSVVVWRLLQIIAEVICLGFCCLPDAMPFVFGRRLPAPVC